MGADSYGCKPPMLAGVTTGMFAASSGSRGTLTRDRIGEPAIGRKSWAPGLAKMLANDPPVVKLSPTVMAPYVVVSMKWLSWAQERSYLDGPPVTSMANRLNTQFRTLRFLMVVGSPSGLSRISTSMLGNVRFQSRRWLMSGIHCAVGEAKSLTMFTIATSDHSGPL